MSEPMPFRLNFGAMALPLRMQYENAHVKPPRGLAQLQKDADAISRLAVRGLLSEAERDRCRTRLMKRIMQAARG